MSAPSEPEKFSIDDMLERLQSPPALDPGMEGELVTRKDGSQAIRVRKRKRRSQQPHKQELQRSRRVRMLQVSAVLILPLLVLFAAATAIVISNSPKFRSQLLQKIARSTGAGVELEQFRMNPASANAARLSLTWPEGNVLQDLTLRNIRADISLASFLGKSLAGEELSAAEGSLLLRIPQPDKPARVAVASDTARLFRFNRYGIPKAQILLGEPAAPLIRMQNAEVSFYPVNRNARAQLLVNRGDITINGWPKLRMDRSLVEFHGTELDVISLRLRHETDNKGVWQLSGCLAPYTPGQVSSLSVQLESFLLSGIVGPELGRLFAGRIDTLEDSKSNEFSFTPGAELDASLSIAFRNSLTTSFEIKGFPFLFGLSQILRDDWFECPVFESEVRGVLRRANGKITISELHFENKNRIALRGLVTMTPDRKLAGKLKVGIADAIIKASRSRHLDALFGPPLEGFRWLSLQISGTTTTPADDFKALYEAATQAKNPEPRGAIPTFEELTQPN